MKTKSILLSLAGVFALSLMFTSCSMSVQKRRYNKGFYVSISDRHHADAVVAEKSVAVSENTPVASIDAQIAVPAENTVNTAAQPMKQEIVAAPSVKLVAAKSSNVNTVVAPVSKNENPQSFSRKEMKAAVQQARHQEKKPASGNIVLEVILAILIPPLGVWLHEGEINTRFWIDLLLTLLVYFPGMIFALLVVLGAI